MDIGPGDFVECVRFRGLHTNGTPAPAHVPRLNVGSIYRVADIIPVFLVSGVPTGKVGVTLVGLRFEYVPGLEGSYDPSCFRPIYRPRETLIRDLLEPAPQRETEDA